MTVGSLVQLGGSDRASLPDVRDIAPVDTSARAEVTLVLRRRAELPEEIVAGPTVLTDGVSGAPPGFEIKKGGLGSAAQAVALATLCAVLFLTFCSVGSASPAAALTPIGSRTSGTEHSAASAGVTGRRSKVARPGCIDILLS